MKRQKVAQKQELASGGLAAIQRREAEGYLLVYTNGSAEFVSTVGWTGGWSCCSADGWEKASYLTPHMRQTINRAEL